MAHHIIYYVSRSTLHPDTYRVAKDNSDKRVHNDLKKLINKHDVCFTGKEKVYLTKNDWISSKF